MMYELNILNIIFILYTVKKLTHMVIVNKKKLDISILYWNFSKSMKYKYTV